MNDHGRSVIVDELKRELIGPDPHGPGVDLSKAITFASRAEAKSAYTNLSTGEEIITSGIQPKRRYAAGVLFPLEGAERSIENQGNLVMDDEDFEPLSDDDFDEIDADLINDVSDDDFELSPVNDRDPSSAALTFVLPIESTSVKIRVTGGRYESLKVNINQSEPDTREALGGKSFTWYPRVPVQLEFEGAALHSERGFVELKLVSGEQGPLKISCFLLVREPDALGRRFCTVAIRNNSPDEGDSYCLFQTELFVSAFDAIGDECEFLPYPDKGMEALKERDAELANLDLLYRDQLTYAIGHGCSGDWTLVDGRCRGVFATYFPTFEAPSVTPQIYDRNGQSLEITMADLMDCSPDSAGIQRLEHLVSEYQFWISTIELKSKNLSSSHQRAAEANITACKDALRRMRVGLDLIRTNSLIQRAFELANEAILYQQSNIPRRTRAVTWDKKSGTYVVEAATPNTPGTYGSWRPFQIGFILASIASTIDPNDTDRATVDLIFFPTGGGKTEAYQALIAISLFHSRLAKKNVGVEVIMRYTLRLLTAQQFLRAASLIAAMEKIRAAKKIDGDRFSIGIWVGKSTSPLKREDATRQLSRLRKSQDLNHPFVLTRCPLCSTSLGAVTDAPKASDRWPGLEISISKYTGMTKTVVFTCPNSECDFTNETYPIPAIVIDEDIFELRPSVVIATLDKFAQVAFSDQIRSLFGRDNEGRQIQSPPNLIIQDELHLISGPLGSISGIYEVLFEEFCQAKTPQGNIGPKIVCSTATIRSASNQVLGLYGRSKMDIFPPSGIDAADSFFATYAREEDGSLSQGQLFVGAIGTSLGSVQDLQSRVAASLLQAPMRLDPELRDPWSTNLAFFNRIQDIGTSFSLLRINTRAMLKTLWSRKGIVNNEDKRYINENAIMELTSRIDSNELPSAIERLSVAYPKQVDVCLASNIIEVGIDIQRLSLMTMLGQPKTTSQYIQVAGRVGRDWRLRPGLIVVQYPPRRSRDRSHFEKFRSFHQRLYANVEPTSVTPWSTQVMERALHAVLVGFIRNFGKAGTNVQPFPSVDFDEAVSIARRRLEIVEPSQIEHFEKIVRQRKREWEEWQRSVWVDYKNGAENPLLNPAGNYISAEKRPTVWETMMSMRSVDASCAVKILNSAILEIE